MQKISKGPHLPMLRRQRAALSSVLLLTCLGASAPAPADDEDTIAYRRHIMTTMDEQTAAFGMMLSGAIPNDAMVTHLEIIALSASIALASFEPNVPGGDAKPEVWSNWEDFAKRMNEFAQKTAELARVAKEQGKDEAATLAVEALDCKSCHEVYNAAREDE